MASSRNALQHASEIDDSESRFNCSELPEFEDSGIEEDGNRPVASGFGERELWKSIVTKRIFKRGQVLEDG